MNSLGGEDNTCLTFELPRQILQDVSMEGR